MNPFILGYSSILKNLILEFNFIKLSIFYTVFADFKINWEYQKISECLHMNY